jgi:hypothetical protein
MLRQPLWQVTAQAEVTHERINERDVPDLQRYLPVAREILMISIRP